MEEQCQNPFLLFPEEVWKIILEKLKDSRDILNMLEAYPEMKDLMSTSRHKYLFDLIIPLVAEWIGERELLNCRRVCKQWSRGLDNMIENQPSLRAFTPEVKEIGQNWTPRDYGKVNNGREMEDPSLPLFKRYFRWRYSFHNQLRIHKFLKDFGEYPPESNPFVGRSVIINRYPWGDLKYIISFWKNAHNLLRTWGSHIWFIEIWEFIHQEPFHFAQSVRESLILLPNLKSLHLEGNLGWTNKNEKDKDKSKETLEKPPRISSLDFPLLPNLETLKLGDGFPDMVDTLIRRYSPQIKRLVWSTRAWNWKWEYGKMFPNLTELVLVVPAIDRNQANELVLTLKAPQLHRLHVGFRGDLVQAFDDDELMAWWSCFPKLSRKHFRIVSGL